MENLGDNRNYPAGLHPSWKYVTINFPDTYSKIEGPWYVPG